MTIEDQYELVILNDEKVNGYGVLFSLGYCFPTYPSELLFKIINEVESLGQAPCMVGTMEECKKILGFLGEDGIPSKISSI